MSNLIDYLTGDTTGNLFSPTLSENGIPVKVKRLHPNAIIPKYQKAGDACFDLHCLDGAFIGARNEIRAPEAVGMAAIFRTGLAFEIPSGYAMLIFSRSGHGFNNDVRLSNCVGVIDSGYRGEVQVKLRLDHLGAHYPVMAGDRIAQAMILPVPSVTFVRVNELSASERGEGGFGSTGVSA